MILTVTANPSLDRTIELAAALQRGAVQRAVRTTDEPGGKGVNVSRALAASGVDTVAVLPGALHDPVLAALRTRGVPTASLAIDDRIRANVTLTEPDGTTTKINEPGPDLSGHADALLRLVVEQAASARWVVFAGSLPPGLPDDYLATAVRAVRTAYGRHAPRIAVDASGAPFAALLASGEPIDLIKPNAEELAELVGGDPDAYEKDAVLVAEAAGRLVARGIRAVLVTLGAAGAVLVTGEGTWSAASPRIAARSTVGAGDSSLAGYLLAESIGAPPARRLAQAVASGAAAASMPGSTVPSLDQTRPHDIVVVPVAPAVTGQH